MTASDRVTCTQCGKLRGAAAATCPLCGAKQGDPPRQAPAYMQMTDEQRARAAAAAPREPVRFEVDHSAGEWKPWHGYAQGALVLFSLPVLVPSLVWMFLNAKRWGRIPLVFVFVDGGILLLFCIPYPRYAAVVVTALVSCVVLYLWRASQRVLEQGVVFGYSNVVAMSIIVGGSLFLGGGCATLPTARLFHQDGVYASPTHVRVERILDGQVPRSKRVVVSDAHVLWDRSLYKDGAGGFTSAPPAPDAETWAPVESTKHPFTLWVTVPAGAPARPTSLDGFLVSIEPAEHALLDTSVRQSDASARTASVGEATIVVADPDALLEWKERGQKGARGIDWKWAPVFLIGLVLVAFAVVRVNYEARGDV